MICGEILVNNKYPYVENKFICKKISNFEI